MFGIRQAALIALTGLSLVSFAGEPNISDRSGQGHKHSRLQQAVTGPSRSMKEAIAAGATATVTLQPVAPKTVPASNYPPGSAIMGPTLTLASVPARVWIEAHVTGWAPDTLKLFQLTIDATDTDGDGGGFRGDRADCDGSPMQGAGDITPARQACNVHTDCEATISGPHCSISPASKCVTWNGVVPNYFPAGKWCEPVFFNRCDALDATFGLACQLAVDLSTINFRWGGGCDPGEVPTDNHPSHEGVMVLDVPAIAKGRYVIEFLEIQCFLQNTNPPGQNNIPVAALVPAEIRIECGSCCTNITSSGATCADGLSQAECNALPSTNGHSYRAGTTCDQAECCNCTSNMDCQDNNACTVDACVDSCYCTHTPVASWDPATECCHPMTGIQGLIPQSSPCKVGGCTLGGSSGTPTLTAKPDGTSCVSNDPCYGDGQCAAGICESEQYAGPECPKARFISYATNTGSTMSAYRVRLVSLHHPNPPYTGAPTVDFSAHEGEVRWVGAPAIYSESSSNSNSLYGSYLQCQPHYQNWSGFDPLHVTGGEIVPSSVYQVQSITQGLDINVESNYSPPITIATARWGETVIPYAPPATSVQPDAGDISGILDKFKNTSHAGSKPRAMFTGPGMAGIPDMNFDVNFSDISVTVDANEGRGYPYPWPASCP